METETRRTNKMASSPNADNNDTCSSFLFTKDDCTPLKFFIRPSETKVKLKALIEARGGVVSSKLVGSEADWIKLAADGDRIISNDYIKAKFIDDCIAEDEILPMDGYRLQPRQHIPLSPSSTTMSSISTQGRQYYTKNDDLAILTYIAKHTDCKVSGNQIWKKMEWLKITDHSWQSMRNRYLKKLERYLGDFIMDLKKNKAATGTTLNGGNAESSGSEGEANSGWISAITAPWTSLSPRVKTSLKIKPQPALVSTGAVDGNTATKGVLTVNSSSALEDDVIARVSRATSKANETVAAGVVLDDNNRVTFASTSKTELTNAAKRVTRSAAAEPAAKSTGTDNHKAENTASKGDQSGTSSDSEFDKYLMAEAEKTSREMAKSKQAEMEIITILDSQDIETGGRDTSQDEDRSDEKASKKSPFRTPRKSSTRRTTLKRDLVDNTNSSSEDGSVHPSPRHKRKKKFILNDDSDDDDDSKRVDHEELNDSDSQSFLDVNDNHVNVAKDVQKLSGIIKRAMEKYSISEKTVAQFLYIHSGDVAQALEHMKTQELPEDKVIWAKEDDDALNSLNPQDIKRLIKKFGKAEVMKRQAFFLGGE